jgi:hypothetical protein
MARDFYGNNKMMTYNEFLFYYQENLHTAKSIYCVNATETAFNEFEKIKMLNQTDELCIII